MSNKIHFVSRRYHIFYKLVSEEAHLLDKRISDVLNIVDKNLSLSQAYAYLFTKGVEVTEMEQNEKGVNLKHAKIAKALSKIMEEKAFKNNLIKLYDGMGLEKFVDLCEELEIDWKVILEEYNWLKQNKPTPWHDKVARLLQDILSDGKPHETDDIKQVLIDADLLDGSDEIVFKRQWDNVRQIASRSEFTSGEMGVWQDISKVKSVTP